MAEEDPPVRHPRGWAVTELAREDLELFSLSDLRERIEALEAEIERIRRQVERKHAGKAAADALFGKPG